MKLEQSFDVAAPVDRVWRALIDVEQVAPCLPGAAVTDRNEDGSYDGTFSVKIGPTSASYTGRLKMEDIDEQAHTATMQAHGSDKRGQGGARATIVSKLAANDAGGTRVEVATDYHITGRLARFGRGGMIEDISQRLLREFAGCLQESMAREPAGGDVAQTGHDAASLEMAESGPQDASPQDASPQDAAQHTPPQAAPARAGSPRPEPAQQTAPVQGLSLVGAVLWERMRRNAAPILTAVAGFLLALLVLRRSRS